MNKETKLNIQLLGLLNLLMDLKFYSAFAIIYFTAISGSMTLGISIFSITMISNAIFELPTGIISDKIGRKKTLILGTIASLSYSIAFAIGYSYWLLVIAAILEGLERAFYSGNNDALLYDTLKEAGLEKEYKTYYGKVSSMYDIAAIIGVVFGGIIVYLTSIRFLMIITIIPKLINLLICFKIKDPKVHGEKIPNNPFTYSKTLFKNIKENNELKKIIVASTVANCVGETTYQFRPIFYQSIWPIWALGIPSLLSNINSFFSNWFAGRIIKKYGPKKVLVVGNTYGLIANISAFLLNNFISPFILVTTSLFPTSVAKNSLLNSHYSDETRASMASLISLLSTISISIIMIFVGLLADNVGIINTLLIMPLFKLITIYLYNTIKE